MPIDLSIYPPGFFLASVALVALGVYGWMGRRQGWGIPTCAVAATVAVWYVGDALYNDYANYQATVGEASLNLAWWQVCLFVATFAAFLKPIVGRIAGRQGHSFAVATLERQLFDHPIIQRNLDRLIYGLAGVWLALMAVALYRIDFDFVGLFAPYLGTHRNPWLRNRIGTGFDSFIALANYFQVFLTASFGVVAAVARKRSTRQIAIVIFFLACPYYLFDRTRNTMVATVAPAVLAWVFGRFRGSLDKKLALLFVFFLAANFWFGFVIANRSERSIARAFQSSESVKRGADARHHGLNMLEELAWVNHFIADRTYSPNWGRRYFAEAVNPIPRALWAGKPLIGIDYAIARGQGGGSSASAGVYATVSTGLIGQGVTNFGYWLGPVAAALLMNVWVGLLVYNDFRGQNPARLMLYSIGVVLTFNLGRDITLITLYPFLFGWGLIAYLERRGSTDTATR